MKFDLTWGRNGRWLGPVAPRVDGLWGEGDRTRGSVSRTLRLSLSRGGRELSLRVGWCVLIFLVPCWGLLAPKFIHQCASL